MHLALLVSLSLAVSGAFFFVMMAAYVRFPTRRIRPEGERRLKGLSYTLRVGINGAFSAVLAYGFILGLAPYLFYDESTSWWRGLLEIAMILALYDLLYYLLHRVLFHQWSVLKRVHAVHHQAKYPVAADSLFLHPVENMLGLALLTFSTWVVGPVNMYAFAVCFFVYSWLNIIVHAGVDLSIPYFSMLARKHDLHHASMKAGNYASITPLPDLLFGTAE